MSENEKKTGPLNQSEKSAYITRLQNRLGELQRRIITETFASWDDHLSSIKLVSDEIERLQPPPTYVD